MGVNARPVSARQYRVEGPCISDPLAFPPPNSAAPGAATFFYHRSGAASGSNRCPGSPRRSTPHQFERAVCVERLFDHILYGVNPIAVADGARPLRSLQEGSAGATACTWRSIHAINHECRDATQRQPGECSLHPVRHALRPRIEQCLYRADLFTLFDGALCGLSGCCDVRHSRMDVHRELVGNLLPLGFAEIMNDGSSQILRPASTR